MQSVTVVLQMPSWGPVIVLALVFLILWLFFRALLEEFL